MLEKYESLTAFEFLIYESVSTVLLGTNFGNIYIANINLNETEIKEFKKSSAKTLMLLSEKNEFKKIKKLREDIRAVELLKEDEILVASKGGDVCLFIFAEGTLISTQYLQRGRFKQDQVWRLIVINSNQFMSSGTYGTLYIWTKSDNNWNKKRLRAHQDSIFCLDRIGNNLVVTNDYEGKNKLWEFGGKAQNYLINQTIGNMQHATSIQENTFAMINRNGRIYQFSLSNDEYIYESSIALASGRGRDLVMYNNYLIAGTSVELIFVDPLSLEGSYISGINAQEIQIIDENIFVLTRNKLLLVNEENATKYEGQRIYNYAKVGLIGHTGVGKTSLCYVLKHQSMEGVEIKSTFGRRIWTFDETDEFGLNEDQRIIFYDIAGQESQIFTFYESLSDSDIILIVFKQTDNLTLDRALTHLKELKQYTNPKCKFYLIQNFIDDDHNAVEGIDFDTLLEKNGIDKYFAISSLENLNVNHIRDEIIKEIDWQSTKRIVLSNRFATVSSFLEKLLELEKIDSMTVDELKEILEIKISKAQLRYILEILTAQGIVEFIRDLDYVIINDKFYNSLKSRIPERIKNANGYILTQELYNEYSKDDKTSEIYVRFQLELLKRNNEAIIFFEGMNETEMILVPRHFNAELMEIPEELNSLIPEENELSLVSEIYNFSWNNFLDSISNLNFYVVDICQNSGVFSTVDRSFCFQILLVEKWEGRKRMQGIKLYFGGTSNNAIEKFTKQILSVVTHVVPDVLLESESINDFLSKFNKKNSSTTEKKNEVNDEILAVFIAYAYSTKEHSDWVIKLASDLNLTGLFDCKLDKWDLYPGKRMFDYMKQISQVDKVIVVCDSTLCHKLNEEETCGIQLEFRFIQNLIARQPKTNNVIPILKEGSEEICIPEELKGTYYSDFRTDENYQEKLSELISALLGKSIYNKPN